MDDDTAVAVAPAPGKAHAFRRLEEETRGAFRLVCTCGWRSSPASSAAEPGREWDRHRRISGWV